MVLVPLRARCGIKILIYPYPSLHGLEPPTEARAFFVSLYPLNASINTLSETNLLRSLCVNIL